MSILLGSKSKKDTSIKKKVIRRVRFNLGDNDGNLNVNGNSNNDHNKNSNNAQELSAKMISNLRNELGTKNMFLLNYGSPLQISNDIMSYKIKLKIENEFSGFTNHSLVNNNVRKKKKSNDKIEISEPPNKKRKIAMNEITQENMMNSNENEIETVIGSVMDSGGPSKNGRERRMAILAPKKENRLNSDVSRKYRKWKLYRVMSGHLGWVSAVCVDPSNEWFCTGSADRTIKIWDLASGVLKLTLTGHISSVRGLAISSRHPYMFSCGEDKTVKCWDLETNRVIRHYHGHLSGVYALALHPGLDILMSGGRDSTCRVWDIRSKAQIMVLEGHKHTVHSIATQMATPQVITGSHDCTIRTWDLRNSAKTMCVLTHHKKAIRSLVIHPSEYTFVSGAADNIKVWKCPHSQFLRNLNCKPMGIVETMSVNQDNVLVSGTQNGYLKFWDYKTGNKFQEMRLDPQPGSLHSECAIFASAFDKTGTRLITGEGDKTIKMFKQK